MMNETTFISLIATLVGIIGGLFALFRGIDEVRQSREIRQQEFRWKQADAAKELLEKLGQHYHSRDAMRMLDWSGRRYEDGNNRQTEPITTELVSQSLRTHKLEFTPDEVYVRDCFESLLDKYDRIENYIRIGLISFDDIKFPVGYYVRLMAHNKPVFKAFMQTYGYELALALFDRFLEWKGANG